MHALIGKKFNMLTIKRICKDKVKYNLMVICECDCGKKKKMRFDNVKRGQSKSCGCQEGQGYKKGICYGRKLHKLTSEELKVLYCDQKMSLREISSVTGISNPTISRWLKEYSIPARKKAKRTFIEKYMQSVRGLPDGSYGESFKECNTIHA